MASLLQTRSRGWPLKGLGLASPDYQVGAHFEALDEGVLVAGSKSFEHFFAISKPAAALCIVDVNHLHQNEPRHPDSREIHRCCGRQRYVTYIFEKLPGSKNAQYL